MAHTVLVEPLNASLSTWGAKIIDSTDVAGHVFDLHVLKNEPISFDASFKSNSSGDFTTLLLNVAFIMVCLGMLFICLISNADENGDATGHPDSMPQKLETLRDVQSREGSWAQVYREAKGEDRQALELLFRCHIISTYEFAESKVSQEHIDECINIGIHMLRQKPLAEWVAMRYEAKHTFEDQTVASFQARSDSRLSRHRSSRSTTPEHTPLGTARQCLSTSSSLSMESQPKSTPKSTPRSSMVHIPRVDYTSTAESQHRAMSRPAMQPPRLDNLHGLDQTQKISSRPAVHIPRVDLHSLSAARDQSYREDDDDPYTTRDIY